MDGLVPDRRLGLPAKYGGRVGSPAITDHDRRLATPESSVGDTGAFGFTKAIES